MPLTAMSNHIDPLEHAKVALGYALPKSHAAGLWGLQSLGCGDDCKCGPCAARNMGDLTDEEIAKLKAGGSADVSAIHQKLATQLATKRPATPGGGNDLISSFAASIRSNFIDPFLQVSAAKAQAKANRPQIITQRESDYTTPAIIVGGAILAGMLFFALAKKKG